MKTHKKKAEKASKTELMKKKERNSNGKFLMYTNLYHNNERITLHKVKLSKIGQLRVGGITKHLTWLKIRKTLYYKNSSIN